MRRSGTAYLSGFNVVLFLILGSLVFFSLMRSVSSSSRQDRAGQVKQQFQSTPPPVLSGLEAKITVYRLPGNTEHIMKVQEKKQKNKKP